MDSRTFDYLKLLTQYESLVESYAAAVRTLVANRGSNDFNSAMATVMTMGEQCHNLRARLDAARSELSLHEATASTLFWKTD